MYTEKTEMQNGESEAGGDPPVDVVRLWNFGL